MDNIINYFNFKTNYSVVNKNNIFNAILCTFELLNDEQSKKYVEILKLQIGITFFDELKIYCCKKNHTSLKYLK